MVGKGVVVIVALWIGSGARFATFLLIRFGGGGHGSDEQGQEKHVHQRGVSGRAVGATELQIQAGGVAPRGGDDARGDFWVVGVRLWGGRR
jgi:hypothetical protein